MGVKVCGYNSLLCSIQRMGYIVCELVGSCRVCVCVCTSLNLETKVEACVSETV